MGSIKAYYYDLKADVEKYDGLFEALRIRREHKRARRKFPIGCIVEDPKRHVCLIVDNRFLTFTILDLHTGEIRNFSLAHNFKKLEYIYASQKLLAFNHCHDHYKNGNLGLGLLEGFSLDDVRSEKLRPYAEQFTK